MNDEKRAYLAARDTYDAAWDEMMLTPIGSTPSPSLGVAGGEGS